MSYLKIYWMVFGKKKLYETVAVIHYRIGTLVSEEKRIIFSEVFC